MIPVQPFLERRPARLLLREREVREVREMMAMMAKARQNKVMSSMKRATKVVQEKLNQVTETKKTKFILTTDRKETQSNGWMEQWIG